MTETNEVHRGSGIRVPAVLLVLLAVAGCGNDNPSAPATAPQITTEPVSQRVTAGQSATFSVAATGTAPLSYQWQKSGTAISGATSASYTTPATTTGDSGSTFTVVVSNSAGSVTSSPVATLTVSAVDVAPQITTDPANQTVTAGQSATFSVVATGTAPLSYQWQKNGTAISGATGATYTTPATTTSDSGSTYTVVVSNGAGSVTSSPVATLTVTAVEVAPQITTEPTSQTVTAGQSATFSVVATGTAPLSYQWQKNGTAISGATSASYTTAATTTGNSGSTFAVVVSNSAGSVTSSPVATLTVNAAPASTDVVTYKNDLVRSGLNSTETTLTPANVNSTTFGLLRTLSVDGLVDAQPLYLSQLTVGGAARNVVFVATEHDSVYAFDTDTGVKLWQVSLLGTGETTSDARGCNQVTPEIGITSTPVIDRSAGAHGVIYLVAMTKDASSNYHQRLHALDVTTGAELTTSPTEIAPTYASTSFAPGQYKERAALLLVNGTLYTSWASHCDDAPYGGWVVAFSESTLQQSAVINLAPNSSGSGYENQGPSIWMSGGGPAADSAGNVYVLMANGKFDTTLNSSHFPSGGDFGNSFVKLTLSGSMLVVADYFAMDDEVSESTGDTDLGSGGIMLLPDLTDSGGTVRQLAVGAGKDANLYVVNRANLGGYSSSANNIWQELSGALPGGIFSTPAYFNGVVYYGPVGAALRAFPITNAELAASPSSQTSTSFTYPGTFPVVSANGTTNAIVWAYQNSSPAVLHAYAAGNLATELYNSNQASGNRDQFGSGNKYMVPTVVGGKVFIGTPSGVAVFGLLP